MGSISARHQKLLDGMAAKAVSTWEWAIGSDVNLDVLNGEAIDEAFEAVREAVMDDLDSLAKRVGTLGHSESYMRGSLFPNIWKTFSATGVMLDFEGEALVPATPKHLRSRLLREGQAARTLYNRWHGNNKTTRYERRIEKQENQIVWNREAFDSMTDTAFDWLTESGGDARNTRHRCARMILAVCWFTGRRPWAEASLHADFIPSDGPDWADGWVRVTGLAKKTKAVVEGVEDEKQIDIPLFGITIDEFLKGFHRLREIQATEEWFQPGNDRGHEVVKAALVYYAQEEMKSAVADAFSPVIDAGYQLKLEVKSFRALYASQGQHRQQDWCLKNGQAPANINGYAKRYIGHFGLRSEEDTAEYLRFTYLGKYPIPPLS